jgi:hypothetical protein
MSCLLKQIGIGKFSAPADTDIVIQFNSLLGSQMTNVLVTDQAGNSKSSTPVGNSVTIQVPAGLNVVQFTFFLSGAIESAPLVESCGGTPPTTKTIDTVQTGGAGGFQHNLFFQGIAAPAKTAPAGGN